MICIFHFKFKKSKKFRPNVAVNLKANRSDQTYDVKATNIVSPADDKPCTVLIGSAKFTALGNLLHLMETRCETSFHNFLTHEMAQLLSSLDPIHIFHYPLCITPKGITCAHCPSLRHCICKQHSSFRRNFAAVVSR